MGRRSGPPRFVVSGVRAAQRRLVGAARRLAPAPVPLLDIVAGHWRVHALGQLARLGVADVLAAGPLDVETVAAKTGCDVDALFRVLRALAAEGLLARPTDRTFALTAVTEPLRSDHPRSIRHTVIQIASPWNQQAWTRLDLPLADGAPAFDRVFGTDLWGYFVHHPAEGEHFDRSMRELSRLDVEPVVAAHDFGRYRRIADIGGGSGQLLAGILAATPGSRGVLYDVERATRDAPDVLAAAGVADRVTVVNGDFLESVPAGCDAYLLRQVLHGHDDEHAAVILARLRDALDDDATLVVLDTLVPDGPSPDVPGFLDLQMLVGPGGRERTEAEMRALLARNGFRLVEVVRTIAPTALFLARPTARS